jgi:predicted  nucleic acid-binding Zn-ribbon protein
MLHTLKVKYHAKVLAKSTLQKKVSDFNSNISHETAMTEHISDVEKLEKLTSECKTLEEEMSQLCHDIRAMYVIGLY